MSAVPAVVLEAAVGLQARLAALPFQPTPPDEEDITPGVVGFVVTFLIAVAALLLILDMSRRIRRTNQRAQVREQLEAELRDAELAAADGEAVDGGSPETGRPAPDEDAGGDAPAR